MSALPAQFVEELDDDLQESVQPNDTTTLAASLKQTDVTSLIAYMERKDKRNEKDRENHRKLMAEQLAAESKKTLHAIDTVRELAQANKQCQDRNDQLSQALMSNQAQVTANQAQLASSIASLQSMLQSNPQGSQVQQSQVQPLQSVAPQPKPKRGYKRKASDSMTPMERERVVASRLNRNELIEKIKQSGLKTKDRDDNIVVYTNFDGFYKDGSRWSKDAMINLLYPLR